MDNEPKDVRLPLMVTRAEAAAIDEWRFANRIPTRAEAIRRIIALGLASHSGQQTDQQAREWRDDAMNLIGKQKR
jgi:hypothetical protein